MSARKVRERPRRRVLKSGAVVWRAQVNVNGKRVSLGTYAMRRDAQARIDDHYDRGQYVAPETLGAYAMTWTDRHPRGERTNKTNDHRVSRILDVKVAGRALRDWPLAELRRKHALELVAHLLVEQGRSTTGAANILRTLSALAEDAITDELCELNAFRGVRIRANDPRATKERREPRTFSFEQMHDFAAQAGPHEPMVRVLSDCGLRLGEMLGLDRKDFDGEFLHVRGNAHDGVFTPGDQATKKHVRSVPVPPSTAELLRAVPARLDSPLMFPTVRGRLWRERNFYRDVWSPARELAFDATPHEFRHSWSSLLNAAGIDEADVAEMGGHSVETMNSRYRHPLRRSAEAVRAVIG